MIKTDIFTEGAIKLPYNGINRPFIRKNVKAVFSYKKVDDIHINIILTDNNAIQKVNESWRGKDNPTDVISFAYREEPFPSPCTSPEELGDIYISLEKALEQSANFGVSLEDEMKRLLVHGILHLLGYDHERSPEDKKIMESAESDVLESL